MRRRVSVPAVALGLGLAALAGLTETEAQSRTQMEIDFPHEGFGGGFVIEQGMTLQDPPVGDAQPPTVAPSAGSHGSTIAHDRHGLLVLDGDSGLLLRTNEDGEATARLDVGRHAAQLVVDDAKGLAYVSARSRDKIMVVDTATLKVEDTIAVREPFGLALSPNHGTLLVTTVADHQLISFDRSTGKRNWTRTLAAEPRGVAVSADGAQAMVGFLTSGAVARVELHQTRAELEYLSLDPSTRQSVRQNPHAVMQQAQQEVSRKVQAMNAAPHRQQNGQANATASPLEERNRGRAFARNVFSVAYVGDGIAVAPHQLSTPFQDSNQAENTGSYGGGSAGAPAIVHRLAFLEAGELGETTRTAKASIAVHQPRALAYDASADTLYVAGFGSDQVMGIANVSQASAHLSFVANLPATNGACAPDGLAVDTRGERTKVFVHCDLSRRVLSLEPSGVRNEVEKSVRMGPELAASPMSAAEQRGAELFRRGNDSRLSGGGVMACANCHAEGRTDGLSWRIEGHTLQTPLLAGRLVGTHPYKWDGKDVDLETSLTNTVGRLGGSGLTAAQVKDVQAFVESLPAPRAPAGNADSIARGRQVFESSKAACSACHDGDRFTDGQRHDFDTNLSEVDTPSLVGLAHSAPYYHDGSARTLRALLLDNGSIHRMGGTDELNSAETKDLIAYLESL